MSDNNKSPFDFDDPNAFDELDSAFEQTKAEDKPKADDTFSLDLDSDFTMPKADDAFSLDLDSDFAMQKADDTLSLGKDPGFTLGDDSDFNFDYTETTSLIETNEDVADLSDPLKIMDCVCPKCAEKTEVDLALMPGTGFVVACTSCNKQIHIMRESCACRAKRKSYEINCANCGKLLDQQAHCHSCGTSFPDYFVIFDPNDVRRKARSDFFSQKWAAIKNLDFSFKSASNSTTQTATGYSPQSGTTRATTSTSKLSSKKLVVPAIILSITVVLIAAGVFTFNAYKSGQAYAESYVKALYGIKMGVDLNVATFTSVKTEWELATAAGRSFSPSISNKDEVKAAKLRGEVDKYMQKMSEPPKKFLQANEKLLKIHSIYLDSEALTQSKPSSLQDLNSSVNALNKKMDLASQELKSSLPDSLKKELENAKMKYKGLNNF